MSTHVAQNLHFKPKKKTHIYTHKQTNKTQKLGDHKTTQVIRHFPTKKEKDTGLCHLAFEFCKRKNNLCHWHMKHLVGQLGIYFTFFITLIVSYCRSKQDNLLTMAGKLSWTKATPCSCIFLYGYNTKFNHHRHNVTTTIFTDNFLFQTL